MTLLRLIWIFVLLTSSLLALNIDQKTTFQEILSQSEIYKDDNRTEDIATITNKTFTQNNEKLIGHGYSPKFDIWIKFKLTNTSNEKIEKIIEYANPLTSYVTFFEDGQLKKSDGLLNIHEDRQHINPILQITLQPYESKEYYIKVSSKITTLLIRLNLWNPNEFYDKEVNNIMILALFFGAIGFAILYNLIILITTRELTYLYVVLFLFTASFHHIMYKGLGVIYLTPETVAMLITCSSCIVALPVLFLALFTQRVLKLYKRPLLNKLLKYLLIVYPITIVILWITEEYTYRSIFVVIILSYLFLVTSYYYFKDKKQISLIFFSWMIFITSGIFMYLSSLGVYDIFTQYPYYVEAVWILGITIFLLKVFTSKIQALDKEKDNVKKSNLNLKEFKHRVANNNQTIHNIIRQEKRNIEEENLEKKFTSLESRLITLTEMSSLLNENHNTKTIDMEAYISKVSQSLKNFFGQEQIKIEVKSNIIMDSKIAIYCGRIINEAITNCFKYAFKNRNTGLIKISLYEEQEIYYLNIKDNGNGLEDNYQNGSGLGIIKKLAILQLEGDFNINSNNGVQLNITWSKNEK